MPTENKRFYWLKLYDDFFGSLRIKRLRKLAGGDTFTIIYLKMQLKAMNNGGILEYHGVYPSVAEEIAEDIDENKDNVLVTLNYLLEVGLAEQIDGCDTYLPYAVKNVGSETASTVRSRKSRMNTNEKMLQCNTLATNCNTLATNCNGEKEIEKDKEIEIEEDKEREPRKRFVPPTIEEIKAYAQEKGYEGFNADKFFFYYESNGWKVGKNPMKSWKATVCSWWSKDHPSNVVKVKEEISLPKSIVKRNA